MGSSSEGSIGSAISSAVEVGIDRLTRVGTGLHRRCAARA